MPYIILKCSQCALTILDLLDKPWPNLAVALGSTCWL